MAALPQQQQEQQQQKHKLEFDDGQHQQELSLSVYSHSLEVDLDNINNHDHNNNNNNNNMDMGNTSSKAGRLPRWTRQEILVLIQGKKVAENRVRRGRTITTTSSSCVEPKWATVSSYCKKHGVNRGAVQCRKRWSNLAGDFKKIKDWESCIQDHDNDSFWLMRNDLRRERKLPGFFDREVYDILDDNHPLQPPPPPPPPPLLFDSCRTAPPDDALFSDLDAQQQLPIPIPAPTPISAKHQQAFSPDAAPTPTPTPTPTPIGVDEEKQAEMGSTSQGERKRKRLVVEDEREGETMSLLQVMEKNGRMLSAQLEAHNINLKLDREDRKDHANSLVAVLNKLADALARIADKL